MNDPFFDKPPAGYFDAPPPTDADFRGATPPKRIANKSQAITDSKQQEKPRTQSPSNTTDLISVYSDDIPLPHAPEVEAAIIGCLLVNADTFPIVTGALEHEDFYDYRNACIWSAIAELFDEGAFIDPVSVLNKLRSAKKLESSGGAEYLAHLVSLSIPVGGLEHYAKIVKDNSILRRMIYAAKEITSEAYRGGYDVQDFLARSESKLMQASESTASKKVRHIGELADDFVADIEYKRQQQTTATGISSGYDNLDDIIGGFKGSRLYIIGGRPAQGKTAFALNLALNFARAGKRTLFASLEMSDDQLTGRALSIETDFDGRKIQNPNILSTWDLRAIADATNRLKALPLYVDDKSRMSLAELRAKCKAMASGDGLDVVMVDYLQIMAAADKRAPREQQIAAISYGLKSLAKDLNVPVISLAQLSRATEARMGNDKRPQLSDLRESGSIEQDADLVMFLYRPEYYIKGPKLPQDSPKAGLMEVIVAKNRHGSVGTAFMRFVAPTTGVFMWNGPLPEE